MKHLKDTVIEIPSWSDPSSDQLSSHAASTTNYLLLEEDEIAFQMHQEETPTEKLFSTKKAEKDFSAYIKKLEKEHSALFYMRNALLFLLCAGTTVGSYYMTSGTVRSFNNDSEIDHATKLLRHQYDNTTLTIEKIVPTLITCQAVDPLRSCESGCQYYGYNYTNVEPSKKDFFITTCCDIKTEYCRYSPYYSPSIIWVLGDFFVLSATLASFVTLLASVCNAHGPFAAHDVWMLAPLRSKKEFQDFLNKYQIVLEAEEFNGSVIKKMKEMYQRVFGKYNEFVKQQDNPHSSIHSFFRHPHFDQQLVDAIFQYDAISPPVEDEPSLGRLLMRA